MCETHWKSFVFWYRSAALKMMVISSHFPALQTSTPISGKSSRNGFVLTYEGMYHDFPVSCSRTTLGETGSQIAWIDNSRWHSKIPALWVWETSCVTTSPTTSSAPLTTSPFPIKHVLSTACSLPRPVINFRQLCKVREVGLDPIPVG